MKSGEDGGIVVTGSFPPLFALKESSPGNAALSHPPVSCGTSGTSKHERNQ